jgi:membrane dipeptidase
MFRTPKPGELYTRYEATLERLRTQHKEEHLAEITSTETLERALRGGEPAAIIGVEGGDFLEGDITRLEIARQQGIVHLQLVHYRVSEVGDISTERPVHHGLTPLGKDIVVACNRLGMLVDVAHGTSEVIDQALALSNKPVIYSHGHITTGSPYYTQGNIRARAIHRPLARNIAKQGGVIGVWPLGNLYPTLDTYAQALIDAADYLGADHVAVGTDIPTLGRSVMPDYEAFPALENLLIKRGVKTNDIANMLGRNYLRVLGQALAM